MTSKYDEGQCAYGGHWYPQPVGHYHSEEECLANQADAAKDTYE